MNTLTEIVDGLADQLRTIGAFDSQVHRVVQRPPVFPAAVIVPPEIPKYGTALDGQGVQFTIRVLVVVGTAEAEKQTSLLPFLDWTGSSSVVAAIVADRKLGLPDVNVASVGTDPPQVHEFPDGTPTYGVMFNVLVFAN